MWVALGRLAFHAVPKDRLLFFVVFIPLGIVLFIGLLFSGPGNVAEHVPLAENEQYYYYIRAAEQMQLETGITVNWQQIMAIDAVVLVQDFSKSSQAKAYSYKDYFIYQKLVPVACPPPPASSEASNVSAITSNRAEVNMLSLVNTTVADSGSGSSSSEGGETATCYALMYFARDYSEVLQMLVNNRVITSDQISAVMKYTLFDLNMQEGGDDHDESYIQIHGNFSFRETIYAWPLPKENNRITSPFGMRIHPVTRIKKGHAGVDVAARTGTEIYSIEAGTVIHVGDIGAGGNAVYVQHRSKTVSKYMHLSGYRVAKGQEVKRGDLIGYAGATGRVTGPHLHLQIDVNGSPVNPLRFY